MTDREAYKQVILMFTEELFYQNKMWGDEPPDSQKEYAQKCKNVVAWAEGKINQLNTKEYGETVNVYTSR